MTTPTTYRELQQTLKAMRERGVEVQCRLNASTEVLLSEYARLTGNALNIKTKKQQQDESQPVRKYKYRELQQMLKLFREDGYELQCKLNAKYEVLETEYERIMNETEQEHLEHKQPQPKTTNKVEKLFERIEERKVHAEAGIEYNEVLPAAA